MCFDSDRGDHCQLYLTYLAETPECLAFLMFCDLKDRGADNLTHRCFG